MSIQNGLQPQRASVRTLPEQIADEIGAAITRGEYMSGKRLLEIEISALSTAEQKSASVAE